MTETNILVQIYHLMGGGGDGGIGGGGLAGSGVLGSRVGFYTVSLTCTYRQLLTIALGALPGDILYQVL